MSCRWRLTERTSATTLCITTLDMVLHPKESALDRNGPVAWFDVDVDTSRIPNSTLADLFSTSLASSQLAAFKMILPRTSGYWCRKNIITQRFRGCKSAKMVKDFATARQHYRAPKVEELTASSLWGLLSAALGAIQLDTAESITCLDQELAVLEAEVLNRLSMPILLPDPIPVKRLALLHGKPDWTTTEEIYRAAREMDIDVYILDEQGHWMQDGPYTSFRKAFIPINMTVDDSLPVRVVEALRNYPVQMDGLISFSDMYLIPAAQAAQTLGLPTSGPALFETCRDKYLTRMIEVPKDFQCVRVDGYSGVADLVNNRDQAQGLNYPLIVKPCAGYGSEGVAKVYNDAELLEAAAKANMTDYGRGNMITIETYIDGPEVDANFVLWEGEPLFFEISDQFPAEADLDTATSKSDFLELDLFLPSALPSREQNVIKESLLRILSKLGCRNGVFHMEARMRRSSMEYRISCGMIDLAYKADSPSTDISAVLIENNCRPPNMVCTSATAHTYGVDYYALHHLIALGDGARVRALAVPFLAGPQYHCDIAMIPVRKGGIFASTDAIGDLERRSPELLRKVIKCGCFFKCGDVVPDPSSGVLTWIAFFIVASSTSRKDVLETVQRIRTEFQYRLVSSTADLTALEMAE